MREGEEDARKQKTTRCVWEWNETTVDAAVIAVVVVADRGGMARAVLAVTRRKMAVSGQTQFAEPGAQFPELQYYVILGVVP